MVTCVCLQSAPLAGSLIFLKVTGHLSETFTPVCCTLSSELLTNNFLTVCTCVCTCVYRRMEEDEINLVNKLNVYIWLNCLTSQMTTSITHNPMTTLTVSIAFVAGSHWTKLQLIWGQAKSHSWFIHTHFWQCSILLVGAVFWAALVVQSSLRAGGPVVD